MNSTKYGFKKSLREALIITLASPFLATFSLLSALVILLAGIFLPILVLLGYRIEEVEEKENDEILEDWEIYD